jgi:hypothetical protein
MKLKDVYSFENYQNIQHQAFADGSFHVYTRSEEGQSKQETLIFYAISYHKIMASEGFVYLLRNVN